MGVRIFTIGHSAHPIGIFLSLLQQHEIEVVVDTRSLPRSKYAPQYDREPLKTSLEAAGIRYIFLGHELGGRPPDGAFYDEKGHVLYDRVAETRDFQLGISRLETGIPAYRVALLCSEENPAVCHRRLLIGRVLMGRGVESGHIRSDGRVQTDEGLEAAATGEQPALFEYQKEQQWKSVPSVLRKGRPRTFSAP